jgi:hypothetical protein
MNVLLEWEPVPERRTGGGKPTVVYERAWVPGGWLLREMNLSATRALVFVPDEGPSWDAKSTGATSEPAPEDPPIA